MNTKLLYALCAVVLVAGGGWWLMNVQTTNDAVSVTDTLMLDEKGNLPGDNPSRAQNPLTSLKDLLLGGKSQVCTFTTSANDSTTSGTVYLSNGKMRGDFAAVAAGKTVASHMISDGDEMRMWQDGESMGFLMKMSDMEAKIQDVSTTEPTKQPPAPIDMDTAANYNCESWVLDVSKFVPPANVMFHSMADMMNMPSMGGTMMNDSSVKDMKTTQCSACDSAPNAETKAECKVALGCS